MAVLADSCPRYAAEAELERGPTVPSASEVSELAARVSEPGACRVPEVLEAGAQQRQTQPDPGGGSEARGRAACTVVFHDIHSKLWEKSCTQIHNRAVNTTKCCVRG